MGAAVAAIIIRREKDLVAHFRQHGALSQSTAKTQSELGVDSNVGWRRLTSRAVVREAGSGRYYLDEPSWEALRRTRQRLVAVLFLLLALGALAWFVTPRT